MIFVHGTISMENRWFPVKIFPTPKGPKVGHESDQSYGINLLVSSQGFEALPPAQTKLQAP